MQNNQKSTLLRQKLKKALERSLEMKANPPLTAKLAHRKAPQQHAASKPVLPVLKKAMRPAPAAAMKRAVAKSVLTPLQQKMKQKLAGSQFRLLNEQLYTTTSAESYKVFQAQPELFELYHLGFASQTKAWPTNPNHLFIEFVSQMKDGSVIVDMGCGTAELAQSQKDNVTVHSFDLVAHNPFITACDIRKTPLQSATVDLCIFSLSLMGTNFEEFIAEAHRILKLWYFLITSGQLKIAEVQSRIPDLKAFIQGVCDIGFTNTFKDSRNKMFVTMDFTKTERVASAKPQLVLTPCLYKRR